MKTLTSIDLIRDFEAMIRGLRSEGLGRQKIAVTMEAHTECRVTPGSVQAALDRLGLGRKDRTYLPLDIKEEATRGKPEDTEEPIEDWIQRRVEASRRKMARASKHQRNLILPAEPVGIACLGDPHVDNEGCDWHQLFEHINILKGTDGILASCVGDMQDNWIGRLARIYSESGATASDGWRASRWLLESLQWVAICGGNHDRWAHGPGVDPLAWLSRECGVKCYAEDEIRITLSWDQRPDLEPIVWVLRHDFGGRSWYHPTHGPHKEAILDGKCHILTAGHIHQWGQLTTEQRHGRVTHAVRVRGYKRADSFARSKGFYEQRHGASCLIVIDPLADEPERIRIFWDLLAGRDYLTYLRGKRSENPE